MDTQVQEKDAYEMPVNPWRRKPTREQVRFAMDLCRTELPYTERVATINSFGELTSRDMSGLLDYLTELRSKRLARLRPRRRSRR